MQKIEKTIENGMFGHVRAYAFSPAKAFLNDFDTKSDGTILNAASLLFRGTPAILAFSPIAPIRRFLPFTHRAVLALTL